MAHTNRTLVIIGAGGHGKVVGEIAELSGVYSKIVYLDNDTSIEFCLSYPVVGTTDDWVKYPNADIFIAVGSNATRQKVSEKIGADRLATLIHPTAWVSTHATIGKGSVVMAMAVVGVDAKLGTGCIVNTGATVDHECMLADFVHISPGAHLSGQTVVGKRSWFGVGSSSIQNITVGSDVVIGAGGVVVRDLIEPGTYIGIPAKPVNKNYPIHEHIANTDSDGIHA
ncbi:MAG: NeuD/PglB/VioB family sugar acetyltransferase [Candidatus Doudnabacteria bacterium]|nr:NeuD/PglB/VioB family sugar acetyltransferase [Candidatus Doudnabacteria bacterium]